jgi:polyisoprenoid-binding protein YceI
MPLPIPEGTYGIDKVHSQIGFAVRHLGISTVRGTFDRFDGSLTVGADIHATTVSLDAEMKSVNSGNEGRDGHLHGDQFFDADNHPTMTFRSTSITPRGDDYVLNGDLTIRGITKPIALDVTFNGSNTFPMDQSTHFGFEATGTLSRSDFGASYGVPMVSDSVRLALDVQFVQPAPTA